MTFIYICKYLNSTESFFFFLPVCSHEGSWGPDEGGPGWQGELGGQKGPARGRVQGEQQTHQWTESGKPKQYGFHFYFWALLIFFLSLLKCVFQTAMLRGVFWMSTFSLCLFSISDTHARCVSVSPCHTVVPVEASACTARLDCSTVHDAQ